MVSGETFKRLALAFEEVVEKPHFHKMSFRVNDKIFATLDAENEKATLKLPEIDQSVFCSFDKTVVYPANGAWGKQGWTIIDLKTIKKDMLQDALVKAYSHVALPSRSKKTRLS